MKSEYIWEKGGLVSDLDEFRRLILKKRLRGDQSDADFLNPRFDFADPFLLTDMQKAVNRIAKAIENREKVLIYGDYDADGVTSLALLYELLDYFDIKPQVYIPDRMTEGYGIKYSVLKRFFEEGISLVITVDCGIREVEVSKKILLLGLDMIVTDHHELGAKIPEAVAIVNPKRPNSKYPERELAGVGVVYALARALMDFMKVEEVERERFLKWNLDLVAVGTVADMVPLLGENRILVKYGLIVLAKSKKKGLRELMNFSGIRNRTLTSWDIGFGLAPRINATGRIDDANHSFNLLIEKEQLEAEILAKSIESKNQERKQLTEDIWEKIKIELDEQNLPACIMMVNEGWSKGVLGLIASKAIRHYNRPAIVATIDGNKVVGSARSIFGINVVKLLDLNCDYLSQYGGHEKAAGLTLDRSNWENFRMKMNNDIEKLLEKEDLRPKLEIDAQIRFDLISDSLWNVIELLHPFGIANEEPLFMTNRCLVSKTRMIGRNNNHFKMFFSLPNGGSIEGIMWNCPDLQREIESGDTIDLVYNLRKNVWQDRENYLLNIIDFKKNEE